MFFTAHNEVVRSRNMTTAFGGYNHKISCQDGEFFDMKNMTTAYYPMLSPRNKRGICRQFVNPFALLDKDSLAWIDDGKLYIDGEEVVMKADNGADYSGNWNLPPVKMGARIISGDPENGYSFAYNAATGEREAANSGTATYMYTPTIMPAPNGVGLRYGEDYTDGTFYNDSYVPKDGEYHVREVDGKYYLQQGEGGTWKTISSDYALFECAMGNDIKGPDFEVGQKIKITVDNSWNQFDAVIDLFPIDEGNGKFSVTTTITSIPLERISNSSDGSLVYYGFIIEGKITECAWTYKEDEYKNRKEHLWIEGIKLKPMLLTECNNRLWGCSEDGHEIYATALGDWKRWQKFNGVSTDSYAATIGSDGEFTGSVTYNGNPIFFKENSMVKVTVSSTGAHQVKEIFCPGVQKGSGNSICIVNGVLYYKGVEGIYAYDGSLPVLVSSSLGEVRYYKAVSGTILDRYYVSMKDGNGLSHMFVYDTGTGMWAKEDNADVMTFCRSGDDLYYIDNADLKLKSVRGTLPYEGGETEGAFDWFVESGNIGFTMPDKKHLAKLQIRLSMELGTNVSIFLQYDSSGNWEHVCNLNHNGTRSFVVPIIPRRCDHFKYMIGGRGECKIFSVTKTIEEGSEV